MNKTLLNHITVDQEKATVPIEMKGETIPDLVRELKHALLQAENELLSPRPEAVANLLKKALH